MKIDFLKNRYFGDAHDPRCEPCAQQDLNQSETSNCSICLQPITGTYLLQNGLKKMKFKFFFVFLQFLLLFIIMFRKINSYYLFDVC